VLFLCSFLGVDKRKDDIIMSKIVKIALDAGHGLHTAGKRCMKAIDPNETREWKLNSRIVEKVIQKLKDYENVEVLRVDDHTGEIDVSLGERCRKANEFNADLYCSFHHDAGISGGNGGGLTVITYGDTGEYIKMRNLLYNCLINAGGIKNNRYTPTYSKPSLYVLNSTKMTSVLVEHGFMDSTVDTPIILTDEYAEKVANGWIAFYEDYLGIKKKPQKTITYSLGRYKLNKKVHIRKKPKITGKSIRTLNKGSVVEVSKISGSWGYVETFKGWICLKNCTYSYKLGKYKLNKALYLRKGAKKTATKIKTLKKGTVIEVIQIQNTYWGYCKNLNGWIYLKGCTYIN
jgi:N-acetylmuramoyl-L-alanine amidase